MKKMRNIWKIGLWTRAHNFHVISWGRMLCAHSHFNSVSQKCGDVLRGNNIFKYLIDCRRFSSTERNRERERENNVSIFSSRSFLFSIMTSELFNIYSYGWFAAFCLQRVFFFPLSSSFVHITVSALCLFAYFVHFFLLLLFRLFGGRERKFQNNWHS